MNLPFECADTAKKKRGRFILLKFVQIHRIRVLMGKKKKHNENTFMVQICQM